MVKKVITNLDSSRASGPDCIPVVVLKNCEPELSYNLAKLFNNCLKESCFPDSWKVSSVVPVFKNVGESSTAKNYHPVTPFHGWGSTASRLEPLRGGSLLFTTKFPEIPDTHFIDLRRMKG